MELWMEHFVEDLPNLPLFLIVAVTLYAIGKGADLLVDGAVALSLRWGVPKVMIGATVVSLGTTAPEAVVSVFAAIKGVPDLALGNAVGSIICDTGLILGLATLIAPLPLDRKLVNRQGWMQIGAGVLLIVASLPFSNVTQIFEIGGNLPQFVGWIFLGLLGLYMWLSIRWSSSAEKSGEIGEEIVLGGGFTSMIKLLIGVAIVIASSQILIPSVEVGAKRIGVPPGIIAATLVAFGTSLPELVTAVTAAIKGHGELAVGNVIGADILNVLFVAGASASVTEGGLKASPEFFKILFPTMLFVLIVFRVGVIFSGDQLKRPFGFVLIGAYVIATVLSYFVR